MNRLLYSLLLHLLLPLLLLRLLWRSIQIPAYRSRITERFALALPRMASGGIWVHAVSVGEVIAAVPMIKALQARYPQYPLLLTCMTPTGAERAQSLLGDQVHHCYLPYDFPWAAARFLEQIQPRLAIIMETELWPNHIHQCARRGIPVVLANARLSVRSARGYARLGHLVKPMLAELSWIAVQTAAEAERFHQLGANEEQLTVTGSIKFDLQVPPSVTTQAKNLRHLWHGEARPSWIAASTHEGEEEQVLSAHRHLLAEIPEALLILVPRHPERFDTVARLCGQQGFSYVRYSSGERVHAHHQILLGDTMGELLLFYALADQAFVGGSLVPIGGHNLLEPAALGRPLLSGPALFNFSEVADQLQNAEALRIVDSADTLGAVLLNDFRDPKCRHRRGQQAYKVLQSNQGALLQLLDGLACYL